jgi:serine protease Do
MGPLLAVLLLHTATLAQSPAFVIDDEDYAEKVTAASARLLREGKLKPVETLRGEVRTKSFAARLAPLAHRQLAPPDLYDYLRQSTLAVGSYYKCPDCSAWHFNGAAGFVISEDGIICTCCHVVQGEDEGVKESYLVAADAAGHVFPVQSVLAADTESDTCFVKVGATGLKPLALRTGVRAGERVYCLSHPGGYYYTFTQGMVSRVNRHRNDVVDEHGHTTNVLTRPILLLNVTAEFAPGSSGAPVTDDAGNVVGQAASIADAGEPGLGDTNAPPSPSVAVRFCVASEEILRLTQTQIVHKRDQTHLNTPATKPKKRQQH